MTYLAIGCLVLLLALVASAEVSNDGSFDEKIVKGILVLLIVIPLAVLVADVVC
ncbi:hypothetical protein ACQXR1_11455 [Bacillus sp. ATD]|uniref:hypothetical protein n=1 Tax=Bacillus TaxID=1386 RepID=UPI0015611CC6|nr:hypothetical protein [Bacillus subtilis]NRF01202.1 hypothetical protein [Bacillus subtilis]NRG35493.1 hypothetical protein [Bacillus subtilis]